MPAQWEDWARRCQVLPRPKPKAKPRTRPKSTPKPRKATSRVAPSAVSSGMASAEPRLAGIPPPDRQAARPRRRAQEARGLALQPPNLQSPSSPAHLLPLGHQPAHPHPHSTTFLLPSAPPPCPASGSCEAAFPSRARWPSTCRPPRPGLTVPAIRIRDPAGLPQGPGYLAGLARPAGR